MASAILSRSLRISCKFFVPRMFRNDVWRMMMKMTMMVMVMMVMMVMFTVSLMGKAETSSRK